MGRYLSWLANGTLLVLCCFLAANTANAVIAAWLAPTPDEVAPALAAAAPIERSWKERQVILDRNLFNASLMARAAPAVTTEELEATKLPLTLIGTAASPNPELAWAAVLDRGSNTHVVLQVGQDVQGKAQVERIEAKRIVLRENGTLRELALADDTGPAAAAPSIGRTQRNLQRRSARARARTRARAARAQPPPAAAPRENPLANAAQLFSEASIVPKFEEGAMVGMQVDSIQPGSIFETAGLESGDVITELNGIPIDSQESSAQALTELAGSDSVQIKVRGADGSLRDHVVPLGQ